MFLNQKQFPGIRAGAHHLSRWRHPGRDLAEPQSSEWISSSSVLYNPRYRRTRHAFLLWFLEFVQTQKRNLTRMISCMTRLQAAKFGGSSNPAPATCFEKWTPTVSKTSNIYLDSRCSFFLLLLYFWEVRPRATKIRDSKEESLHVLARDRQKQVCRLRKKSDFATEKKKSWKTMIDTWCWMRSFPRGTRKASLLREGSGFIFR